MRVKVNLGVEPAVGLPAMVGYSIAGHVAAFVFIVLAPHLFPSGPPPPRILAGEIVSLPPPKGIPAGSAASPAPAAPPKEAAPAKPRETTPPKETAPKPPRETAPPPKKAREVIPAEPDKPKPKKAEDVTSPSPGRDEGAERPPSKSAGAPAAAGPIPEGVGLAVPAGDASGIPSLNSAAFPYDWYRATIVNLIRSRWRRPVTPGLTAPLRCSVGFVISKSGALSEIAVVASSGFPTLDLSALRAVTESSPLPQLPYQYTSESIRGELVFELTPD